jgi:hypothetical protein
LSNTLFFGYPSAASTSNSFSAVPLTALSGAGSSGNVPISNGTNFVSSALSTITITRFTTSGTWTKATTTKMVHIIGWGGGSGGGSGARVASGTACSGGAGATGSGYIDYWGDASLFASSSTVTIGAGGTGGAAITVNSTAGNGGNSGGYSLVGDITSTDYFSYGSGGGIAGNASAGNYPFIISNYVFQTQQNGNSQGSGVNGAAGNNADVIPQGDIGSPGLCPGANGIGGGGGGISTTPTAFAGGNGSALVNYTNTGTRIAAAAGGTVGAGQTGTNGSNGGTAVTTGGLIGAGQGGGGGAANTSATAGSGGNGGIPGGGGGGGGSSLNGHNSGAGGAGARGEVWIYEFA